MVDVKMRDITTIFIIVEQKNYINVTVSLVMQFDF